jgi:hypothetical protein
MSYYLYFIRVDDNTIKYGKSGHLIDRLKSHHKDFVKKLKLYKKLHIIKIIKFNKEFMMNDVETMLKRDLCNNNRNIDKYTHTELFSTKHYNIYMNKLFKIVKNLTKFYENVEYDIMSDENISMICDNISNFNYMIDNNITYTEKIYDTVDNFDNVDNNLNSCSDNSCSDNSIDINKNIDKFIKLQKEKWNGNNYKPCLRCGEQFKKLSTHITTNKLCNAIHLDISYKDMIDNYEKYYTDYYFNLINKAFICNKCDKIYKNFNSLTHHKLICNI